MSFLDYFSKHAGQYAAFRPHYPASLYEYLASLCEQRELAWDCATGNGQAAEGLSRHFRYVVATDGSRQQLQHATGRDNIGYCAALAEHAALKTGIVDMVTVAQALHWLEPQQFFNGVHRVLKPQGVAAVWCYNLLEVDPQIDALLLHFYKDIVGPYWAPERKLLEAGYRTIPFPFEEINAPPVYMEAEWKFSDLIGYMRTWSSAQKYEQVIGSDPLEKIGDDLLKAWGDPETTKRLRFPLSIRAGRKHG